MPCSILTEKDRIAIKKFKEAVVNTLGDELIELKLFGSKARGDANEDSDIDILVITKSGNWHLSDIVCRIATDILLDENITISPRVIGKDDHDRLYEKGYPFIKNVVKDGILI